MNHHIVKFIKMKPTEHQIDFLLTFFPDTTEGSTSIAIRLIIDGRCIVANNDSVWRGGIGNYIKVKPFEPSVDCFEYTFDLQSFLKSQWFKSTITPKIESIKTDIDLANKKLKEILDLANI